MVKQVFWVYASEQNNLRLTGYSLRLWRQNVLCCIVKVLSKRKTLRKFAFDCLLFCGSQFCSAPSNHLLYVCISQHTRQRSVAPRVAGVYRRYWLSVSGTVLLWYESSRGVNGSQGGLAALASVLPSGCRCFTAVDVEYPADTTVAQPAAGHPVHRRLGNHTSTAQRLYTAEEPGHTWYYSKVKA